MSMKEITGNVFSSSLLTFADAICVTTNGFVKKNGKAVMGAGVAKQARDKFEGIDSDLGRLIKRNGNIVQVIRHIQIKGKRLSIVSFPTKYNWWEKSDLKLIENSIKQLLVEMNHNHWGRVILPRPGCKNGKLSWLSEVKPLLEIYLDERFYIIDRG